MKTQNIVQIAAIFGTISTLVVIGCGGALSGNGASNGFPLDENSCGTLSPNPSQMLAIEAALIRNGPSRAGGNVTIPVYVHIITSDTGEGDISDATIAEQVTVLNAAFAGQQAPGGFDTSYRFQFMSTDRTANSVWYNATQYSPQEAAMKTALRRGSMDDLNLYIHNMTGGLGGWAEAYWASSGMHWDGINVRNICTPGSGTVGREFGDTAVHEVGHWIGLLHTFEGGCSKKNDLVSDTPAEQTSNYNCPAVPRNTCTGGQFPGNDPTMNFMDYTMDSCKYQFTAGQNTRMDSVWNTYRAGK